MKSEPSGGIDFKWLSAMVLVIAGWAVNIGMIRQQVVSNADAMTEHVVVAKEAHSDLRATMNENGERIRGLELRQERIEAQLGRILSAIERLDRNGK